MANVTTEVSLKVELRALGELSGGCIVTAKARCDDCECATSLETNWAASVTTSHRQAKSQGSNTTFERALLGSVFRIVA